MDWRVILWTRRVIFGGLIHHLLYLKTVRDITNKIVSIAVKDIGHI